VDGFLTLSRSVKDLTLILESMAINCLTLPDPSL
jgi:hypothetical protein